jgi:hypothetical protein
MLTLLDFTNGQSVVKAQRAYRRKFNVRSAPSKSMIKRCVDQIRARGNVSDKARIDRLRSLQNAKTSKTSVDQC